MRERGHRFPAARYRAQSVINETDDALAIHRSRLSIPEPRFRRKRATSSPTRVVFDEKARRNNPSDTFTIHTQQVDTKPYVHQQGTAPPKWLLQPTPFIVPIIQHHAPVPTVPRQAQQ